jgi:hypothetical protein
MATYKVTMALNLVFNLDPEDHPERFDLEENDLDPYDKKDVHKFLQESWPNFVDSYVGGEWELNELKVEKNG